MIAVCPGSFDPFTLGHLDVVSRAAALFDEVVVAVGVNSLKSYLFDTDERVELAGLATAALPNVRVERLDGLLMDFARGVDAQVVVKGLRFASDFDFELQMAQLNGELGGVETLLLPATSKWGTLSATMVREIAVLGGDVSALVPEPVAERIRERMAERVGQASTQERKDARRAPAPAPAGQASAQDRKDARRAPAPTPADRASVKEGKNGEQGK
jgi:pantetheine-phosphate adenylyltransferase